MECALAPVKVYQTPDGSTAADAAWRRDLEGKVVALRDMRVWYRSASRRHSLVVRP